LDRENLKEAKYGGTPVGTGELDTEEVTEEVEEAVELGKREGGREGERERGGETQGVAEALEGADLEMEGFEVWEPLEVKAGVRVMVGGEEPVRVVFTLGLTLALPRSTTEKEA